MPLFTVCLEENMAGKGRGKIVELVREICSDLVHSRLSGSDDLQLTAGNC